MCTQVQHVYTGTPQTTRSLQNVNILLGTQIIKLCTFLLSLEALYKQRYTIYNSIWQYFTKRKVYSFCAVDFFTRASELTDVSLSAADCSSIACNFDNVVWDAGSACWHSPPAHGKNLKHLIPARIRITMITIETLITMIIICTNSFTTFNDESRSAYKWVQYKVYQLQLTWHYLGFIRHLTFL